LQNNPSAASVAELYDFMSYKELPITEDGLLIAYKGVRSDGYSAHGNLGTVVTSGEVNDEGRILNRVGDVIEVARNQVDDDRARGCSFGLHVGSYGYAKDFGGYSGQLLTVSVDPADVVSVPTDSSFQKMRVSKYTVLEVTETEITSPAYEGENLSAGDKIMETKVVTPAPWWGQSDKVQTVDEIVVESLDANGSITLGALYQQIDSDDFTVVDLGKALQEYGYSVTMPFGAEPSEAQIGW
jgi:hypothetical protein